MQDKYKYIIYCQYTIIEYKITPNRSLFSLQINLGVCQENPSTTAGTIAILENLQQYIPRTEEDDLPVITYGDGLSCERHNDVHMARSNGATVLDKLQGLQSQVQEFHKRMLLMQVIYS